MERGDPTVLGWVTVALYAVGAGFAAWAARRTSDRRLSVFWGVSAVGLLLLGINKQLDAQTDVIRVAKGAVTRFGLYPAHRTELMVGVGLLAIIGLVLAAVIVGWLTRGRRRELWLAMLGWFSIAMFIALRAATFHHLDELGLGFVRWTGVVVLEVGGIAALVLASRKGSNEVSEPGHKSP